MKVLFVCTGNTCRSPMAEAILKSKQLEHIEVRSAGIFAYQGTDASPQAKEVLKQQQIDPTHTSTSFGLKEAEWADLILTMTASHKDTIVNHYPEHASKVFTLKEYVGVEGWTLDVMDPYGGTVDTYKQTFLELQDLIEKLIKKL